MFLLLLMAPPIHISLTNAWRVISKNGTRGIHRQFSDTFSQRASSSPELYRLRKLHARSDPFGTNTTVIGFCSTRLSMPFY